MFRVENCEVYYRGVTHMEAGTFTTPEGGNIKFDSCYKLECDIVDPETRKPATIIFRIKDDEKGKNLASDLSLRPTFTKLLLSFDVVLNKSNQAKLWVIDCIIDD